MTGSEREALRKGCEDMCRALRPRRAAGESNAALNWRALLDDGFDVFLDGLRGFFAMLATENDAGEHVITWAALEGASVTSDDEDVARHFIRAAWSVLDADANDEVTFDEFVRGTFLALVALESKDDRLLHELSFRVMDLNNDGFINRPEMLYWVEWLVKVGALAATGPPANLAMQRRASSGRPPADADAGGDGDGDGGETRTGHTDQEVLRAHRGERPRKDRKKHGNKMASSVSHADAWCDAIMQSMDKNHDGQISEAEWMELQDVLPIARCIIARVNGSQDGTGAVIRLLMDAAGHHDDE